jgi:hypothetical protein
MRHIRRLSRLPILFAFVAATGGIASAENLDLPYRPAVGSRWIGTVEVRETKTKGQGAESTIVREKNEHRIVGKLETGYRITYTVNDESFEGNGPLVKLMSPVVASMKGLSITFETDEGGAPVRIPDVAKLKGPVIKAIDVVVQSKPEFATVPQLKQFMDGLRAQYDGATPETGVQLFLDKLLTYSTAQGLTDMPVGKEQSYDDEIVNPLLGTKMRAKGSVKITAVDPAAGLATIEWQQVVLPEDLTRATMEVVRRILPNADQGSQEFMAALAQAKIDLLDRATYKVALADGVTRHMEKATVLKMQGGEKNTTVIMTLNPGK